MHFLLLLLFSIPITTWAYPNFIGYGYTTCISCHSNPQGHGPINDYGRALFAQEIAARGFASEKISDEMLAEKSGFFGKTEAPAWFQPGLKYRGLWFQTNPGSAQSLKKYIHMQREVNLTMANNAAGTWMLVNTWNLLPEARNLYSRCKNNEPCVNSYFREQYLRWRANRNLILVAGLTDKVYGLRIVDHTAVSRSRIGLGQYDQTHGLTATWMMPSWDVAVQMHAGHLSRSEDVRQKGFSALFETEIGEKHRLGVSVLSTQSDVTKAKRIAIHDRWGLSHSPGSSLMWEFGITEDEPAGGQRKAGTYGLLEGMLMLTRGYNLLTTIERSQAEVKSSSPEVSRWSLGLLMFPLQKTEFRMAVVNAKNFTLDQSTADSWQAQGQVHVSW